MKAFKNGLGVVFDIRASALDAFLENFNRLKETGDRIDFEVEKCQALPELEEDGSSGGNWRDQGRDQGGDRQLPGVQELGHAESPAQDSHFAPREAQLEGAVRFLLLKDLLQNHE